MGRPRGLEPLRPARFVALREERAAACIKPCAAARGELILRHGKPHAKLPGSGPSKWVSAPSRERWSGPYRSLWNMALEIRPVFNYFYGHSEDLMTRILSLLILMTGSVAFAGESGFQEPAPNPTVTAPVGRSANDVLNVLAKRLSLTEDQKSKILPIIMERQRKIQEVWTASTLFVRQKQMQVRGINEESDRRINALLTGEQQKTYFALEQERKVQRRLRRAQSEQTPN